MGEPPAKRLGMVSRDMCVVRLRLLIGLGAGLAIFTMAALTVAASTSDAAPSEQVTLNASVASSSTPTAIRPGRAGLPERLDALLPEMLFALAAGLLAVGVRMRSARRIGDVGDGWRSLLYGAPPLSATS